MNGSKAVSSVNSVSSLHSTIIFRWMYLTVILAISCALASAGTSPRTSSGTIAGRTVAHNTPVYVSTARSLGSEDPAKTIEVSIWLNPHNRAELDALAQQLYDPASPNYRHFLSRSQFGARFAPTASEAKTVQAFFESHNLKVVKVAPHNFFVRARGTVGDIEAAFHVKLNNYQVGDKILRANDRDPYVDGAAAPLVKSVAGLDTGRFEHPAMARPAAPSASKAARPQTIGSNVVPSSSDFFTNNCFDGVKKETFSTNDDGSFPIGTYSGNHLNMQSLTNPGCAYTPPEIQTAYHLTGLYKKGYDGSGQTIGIIDWCGSSTILSDANAFSAYFGLPTLTSSNFAITYIPTQSTCIAADQSEINIDVEWAHAIAPGARINLIVPPSSLYHDVDQAEYIAIDDGLANVISGSFGSEEIYVPATELENGNLINEIGTVLGISTNFSTGDYGDFTFDAGYPASVSYPADSPYATAVGGITLALNANNSIAWQAGWGNNEIALAQAGTVYDPPLNFGFYAGSGGGPSTCATQDSMGNCLAGFPKPSYQKALGGKYRQVPDVSWLADPFTGVAILITVPGQLPDQVWQVWGGTSVACPMFSALWAIANQEALAGGGSALGLAAPYLYSMPVGTIYDIVPLTSQNNVKASIQESGTTTTKYTPAQVAQVTGPFIDAIWDFAWLDSTAYAMTFETDSGLKIKKGWDSVTGVGVPNGQAFADYFYGK
jgi:subtilase family serine protease